MTCGSRRNTGSLNELAHSYVNYEHVPLTHNLAERTIRSMIVTRKISGGSRSRNSAKIHAINMSVLQTLKMKKTTSILTLQKHFLMLSNN